LRRWSKLFSLFSAKLAAETAEPAYVKSSTNIRFRETGIPNPAFTESIQEEMTRLGFRFGAEISDDQPRLSPVAEFRREGSRL